MRLGSVHYIEIIWRRSCYTDVSGPAEAHWLHNMLSHVHLLGFGSYVTMLRITFPYFFSHFFLVFSPFLAILATLSCYMLLNPGLSYASPTWKTFRTTAAISLSVQRLHFFRLTRFFSYAVLLCIVRGPRTVKPRYKEPCLQRTHGYYVQIFRSRLQVIVFTLKNVPIERTRL